MNTLIFVNGFVYIRTPIRYTQSSLCIPECTQTITPGLWVTHDPQRNLWDTYDPQHSLCDMKCTLVSHYRFCAKPVTHNDRIRPATGILDRGAGVAA